MSCRRKFVQENVAEKESGSRFGRVYQRSKSWIAHQQSIRRTRNPDNFINGGKRGRGRGGGASSSSSSPTSVFKVTRKPSSSTTSTSSLSSTTLIPPSRSSGRKVLPRYYSVEEILGRRECQGKIEYLLKWKGYPAHYNSWETVGNLTNDLLLEFELLSGPVMEMLSKEPKAPILLKDTPIKIWDMRKTETEQLEYYVSWQTDTDLDWVSGDIMKQAFPHLVIDFYERISKFID